MDDDVPVVADWYVVYLYDGGDHWPCAAFSDEQFAVNWAREQSMGSLGYRVRRKHILIEVIR